MVSVEYQVMTDGSKFRVRSICKQRGCFRTYKTYSWESYTPMDSYEDAVMYIRNNFGAMAHIVSREWRPA